MILWILLAAFAVRAWPRLVRPNVILSDTYFHLYCARLIGENRLRIPRTLPRVMHLADYSYPFGYQFFLAVFPEPVRRWLERLTGAIFDTLNILVCYWFSVWAVAHVGGEAHLGYLPSLVAALMSFSPALLRLGSGPRAYNGSPRVVGQSLYVMHVLLAYLAWQTGSWFALVGSLAAGAAVLLTAKFSNQVLVFFGFIFCLVLSPLYALLLLGSVALAALITRGRAMEILVGQITHSIFYFKHLQPIFLHKRRRTFRLYWDDLIKGLRYVKRGNFQWFFQWFFAESHPVHLLATSFTPFLLLPFWLFLGAWQDPLGRFLMLWSGAGCCWFLVTKTKTLAFLGEGERYLEYALFPSLFLAVYWLGAGPVGLGLVAVYLVYCVAAAVYYGCTYVRKFSQLDREFAGIQAAFANVNQLEPGVILPIGPFHWQALYLSRFPVLTFGGNFHPRRLSPEEFQLVYGNYPHPSEHLDKILADYQVRYIVSDRAHLAHYFGEICRGSNHLANSADVLADSDCLVVYRVPARSGKMAA